MRVDTIAAGLIVTLAFTLHGCGGSGGGDQGITTTTPAATTTTTHVQTPLGPQKPTQLFPIQSLTYEALPVKEQTPENIPGRDLGQIGYENQWGPDGRDDLGLIKQLGATAVRLNQGFGEEYQTDHGKFLDRAQELGMHVIVGFNTANLCPKFDCSQAWKEATKNALTTAGYAKNGTWHPAIGLIIIQDRPDSLAFAGDPDPPQCSDDEEAKCRVRAALSAIDGFLSAEKEAGIDGSSTKFAIAWGFQEKDSIDGKIKAQAAIFGFQDMKVAFKDPSVSGYEPSTSTDDLKQIYKSRFVNAFDTAATWDFINIKIASRYKSLGFSEIPWFISEFSPVQGFGDDLKKISQAVSPAGLLGVNAKGFQHDYLVGSAESTGLFGLGQSMGTQVNVCQEDVHTHTKLCYKFDVSCLDVSEGGGKGTRAADLANAWSGRVFGKGECSNIAEEQLLV